MERQGVAQVDSDRSGLKAMGGLGPGAGEERSGRLMSADPGWREGGSHRPVVINMTEHGKSEAGSWISDPVLASTTANPQVCI